MSRVRVGIGGWSFDGWRGSFYPKGLPRSRELEHASRAVSLIEVNGTFYSTFAPDTFQRWHDETPDDFVFTVKASRFCTNRKVLASAGDAIDRFVSQGLDRLGDKLGPIVWQLAAGKQLDLDDLAAFVSLLPRTLRHALEAEHASFRDPRVAALARQHGIALVDEPDHATASFTYARWKTTEAGLANGLSADALAACAKQARAWTKRGDVFALFIAGAKEKNPSAAMALQALL